MYREPLPITSLPAWLKLNDVSFIDISIQSLGQTLGFGLLTAKNLNSEDTFEIPTLLEVPCDLVLSAEGVEEWAKVDSHLRQLVEVVGGKSVRGDAMLFLLMQITIAGSGKEHGVGLKGPWTEYCRVLPSSIPVPTMWSEEEIMMLRGTSLEPALIAKMSALAREFEELKDKTKDISWCQKCWWENGDLSISDWLLLDAWYRSRSLELPKAGESMVPCLDMANHSSEANSYYEQTPTNSVVLLLRPDVKLDASSEITISYGDSKSEAEMLFSYGFIDEKSSSTQTLLLPLQPLPEDPLGKAKVAVFIRQPVLRIYTNENSVKWECPFLYLMGLNEEDGLQFKVLQQTDRSRSSLRVFWQGDDVTNVTDTFETLIEGHELKDIFRLRAITLLQDRISQQLERLQQSDNAVKVLPSMAQISPDALKSAIRLRASERSALQRVYAAVDEQKAQLFASESVLSYLLAMEKGDEPEIEETNKKSDEDDLEDFS